MSLITRKPSAPAIAPTLPVIPEVVSAPNRSTIVDTERQPRSTLVAFVEGAVYTVNYYSQILSRDEATFGHDPNESAVSQQFKKINRLEIRLTQSLNGTQDPNTMTFSLTGAGHITHGVIPNAGDMFVADVGDGREGVFQVTLTEKRSFFKDAVYHVEFKWLFFVEADPSRAADLENKVEATYHYLHDMAKWGQNPVVADGRYHSLLQLQELKHQMIEHYLESFYSKTKGTLLVPGQVRSTYDAFLTEALHATIDANKYGKMVKIRQWSTEDDNMMSQPTLWKALIKRDRNLLYQANAKMGIVNTSRFTFRPTLRSMRYSGVDACIYPVEQNKTLDSQYNSFDKVTSGISLIEADALVGDTTMVTYTGSPPTGVTLTPIKNVLVDDYYVLSRAFYANSVGMSLLEKLTWDFLQGEGVDPEHLFYVARNYYSWGGLERFYYIPLVIILIQSFLRDTI